ncbi:MAG: response regulator [Lachnospiraceae bacterium]|nr:response regulator [Lachnospiraceae bacterium]
MAKVLIVDDSRTSRRMLRNILSEHGHEVVGEAENGQVGYEKFIELEPDIVTLDITMPVLDGLGALDKIMNLDEEAIVIMVSAAGQKEKMVEAIKLGATEFIQKPFQPEQILNIIDSFD